VNTGENFSAGGEIQTSTSVYSAIGQALPSPPPETIEEIRVDSSMYDASEVPIAGHISFNKLRAGRNDFHGGRTSIIRRMHGTRAIFPE